MPTGNSIRHFLPPLVVYVLILNVVFCAVVMQLNRAQINFIYQEAAQIFGFEYPLSRVVHLYQSEEQTSVKFIRETDKELNFFRVMFVILGLANTLLVTVVGLIFLNRNAPDESGKDPKM